MRAAFSVVPGYRLLTTNGRTDKVYERYEHGSGQRKLSITAEVDMRAFVRGALATALGEERTAQLKDDTDLFAAGVDSLQARRVRNACQMRLELGGVTLGHNIAYEHPSVAKYVRPFPPA